MTFDRAFEGAPGPGEVVRRTAGKPLAQALADVPAMPLTAIARARVMGIKLIGQGMTEPRPGDVPADGTPGRQSTGVTTGGTPQPVVAASRSIPDTARSWTQLVEQGAVLAPPYDPWALVVTVDESEVLPAAIEAMAVNIAGHGLELLPLFPTRDPTTGAEIKPPPEAVAEREDLELFLAGLALEHGLEGTLELADRDVETIGWGTLELMRDGLGQEAAIGHIPAYTIRLGPEDPPVLVNRTIRHPTTGEFVTLPRWQRFRRFAQVKDGQTVWFKQYGDPRHVNCRTGQVRPETAAPWEPDKYGNSTEATEIIYVRRYHPATPYGVPLWLGGVPQARAGRSASELLVDYFDNAPIGVHLAMVGGGKFREGSLEALSDQLNYAGRGRDNAWSVLGIEAEAQAGESLDESGKPASPKVLLESLNVDLPADWYKGRDSLIDRAAIRLRSMFRLGGIYFGDSEAESNRAAADTARAIGEEQVFRPIRRKRWEHLFNTLLLPARGVNYWKIGIKGATTADDTEGLVAALTPLVAGGGASPNDLKKVLASLTDTAVELIAEDWADKPLQMVLQLLTAGLDPNLSLAELAVKVEEKAAEAAQQAQDAINAAGAAGPGGKPGGKPGAFGKPGAKPPPAAGKVAKSLTGLVELLSLRADLAEELQAQADAELVPDGNG